MLREEFVSWRHSPVGKWFFDTVLAEEISFIAEKLVNGSCKSEDPGKVAMHYMDQAGVAAGIEQVRNLDPFHGENIETESNRTPPVNQDGR